VYHFHASEVGRYAVACAMQFPQKMKVSCFFRCHIAVVKPNRLSEDHAFHCLNGSLELNRGMPQRGRLHFPEDSVVSRREPTKLKELVAFSNLRDTCRRGIGSLQGRTYQVQSSQPKIPAGAHAQELYAACLQRPLRHTDGGAKLGRARR